MAKTERIIILGGGYSVKAQDVRTQTLMNHGLVIGVNDSCIYAPCDVGVSMDRLWMENRLATLQERETPIWLRQSAYRVNLKDSAQWPGLYFFENDHTANELSEDSDTLNGFNSGVCAINLAYHLKPHEVYLFGFDMNKSKAPSPYWYPSYNWPQAKPEGNTGDKTYVEWSQRFHTIAGQMHNAGIKVFNVNPDSALNNFTKIDYEDFTRRTSCVH